VPLEAGVDGSRADRVRNDAVAPVAAGEAGDEQRVGGLGLSVGLRGVIGSKSTSLRLWAGEERTTTRAPPAALSVGSKPVVSAKWPR
jgi:hypothetical protein